MLYSDLIWWLLRTTRNLSKIYKRPFQTADLKQMFVQEVFKLRLLVFIVDITKSIDFHLWCQCFIYCMIQLQEGTALRNIANILNSFVLITCLQVPNGLKTHCCPSETTYLITFLFQTCPCLFLPFASWCPLYSSCLQLCGSWQSRKMWWITRSFRSLCWWWRRLCLDWSTTHRGPSWSWV